MASSMSWSVGAHFTCGLGVPFGVIARQKLPHTSYWLLASPIPARSCGCVATTWYASMKASCATFQLQASTLATWACL